MIMDYDPPLKKLSEEFVPHAKLLYSALISLWPVYISHNISADKWRYVQFKTLFLGNFAWKHSWNVDSKIAFLFQLSTLKICMK